MERGRQALFNISKERNMVFWTHTGRFLGLSKDGASRQADLKCFQTDIMLQRVSPCGPEAEPECEKGTRELEFRLPPLPQALEGLFNPSGVLCAFLVEVVCGLVKQYL